MLNVLSLFSGIGAYERALENLNIPYSLLGYSEIDKYASKAYSILHNVPESMNLGDVRAVDGKQFAGKVDLLTFSWPCTDISISGKKEGFFDKDGNLTRSGLFFEAARIISECKPKFAIAENVRTLTADRFSKEFGYVKKIMDDLGYTMYYKIMDAQDYGVPQHRERLIMVYIRKDIDKGFEFPAPFELKLRLKDVLDEVVEDKYYLSEYASSNAKFFDKAKDGNGSLGAIGSIRPERKCQSRERIFSREGVCPALAASDYKEPTLVY